MEVPSTEEEDFGHVATIDVTDGAKLKRLVTFLTSVEAEFMEAQKEQAVEAPAKGRTEGTMGGWAEPLKMRASIIKIWHVLLRQAGGVEPSSRALRPGDPPVSAPSLSVSALW